MTVGIFSLQVLLHSIKHALLCEQIGQLVLSLKLIYREKRVTFSVSVFIYNQFTTMSISGAEKSLYPS